MCYFKIWKLSSVWDIFFYYSFDNFSHWLFLFSLSEIHNNWILDNLTRILGFFFLTILFVLWNMIQLGVEELPIKQKLKRSGFVCFPHKKSRGSYTGIVSEPQECQGKDLWNSLDLPLAAIG